MFDVIVLLNDLLNSVLKLNIFEFCYAGKSEKSAVAKH